MPCGGIAVMYMKGGRPSGAPFPVRSVAVRSVIGKADEGMFFCTGAFFSYRCPVSAAYLQG